MLELKHRPDELGVTLPPINVGVTAGTVRAELVALGTALNAKVPGGARYVQNADGTVTANFIQVGTISFVSVLWCLRANKELHG